MFKIRCAFRRDPNGEAFPELVAAVDEWTLEVHDIAFDAPMLALPDFYTTAVKDHPEDVREMVISLPEHAVLQLFKIPTEHATIEEA